MKTEEGVIRRRFLLMLILLFGLPVVGWREYVPMGKDADQRFFYGAVKGASISPDKIPQYHTDDSLRANLEIKQPVRIDVFYSPPGIYLAEEILEKTGVIVFPEDHVEFFPDPKLGIGSKITILRAREVVVYDGEQVKVFHTWAKTVGELLEEREIQIGAHDILMASTDQPLRRRGYVVIKRSEDRQEVERFELPFNVIVKDDPNLPNGKVKIWQQGERGERQKIWHVVKREGVEIERTLEKDFIAQEPQDRIVLRGTKPVSFEGPYYDWIQEAARIYGADAEAMYRVMMCESGGDPYAVSPSQKYKGLYQYDTLTWSASGWGNYDRFDAYAQINAAAKAWPSRYTKWPVTSRICGDLARY